MARLEERHQRTVLARFQLDAGHGAPELRRRRQAAAAPGARCPPRGPAAAAAPAAALRRRRRRLRRRRPAAPTSEKVTFAADTFFDFDKAVLKPEAPPSSTTWSTRPRVINLEVIIAVGHTDSTGPAGYNQQLCRCARAERGQELSGEQGHREEPRLHRRQGREAAVADNKTAKAAPRTAAWKSKWSVPAAR
jgi:OmpA-OmpF porin, OOP family